MPELKNEMDRQTISTRDITRDMLEEDARGGGLCSCCSSNMRRLRYHERELPARTDLMTCPNCRMAVHTRRVSVITRRTHIAAAIFCCIPYFFKNFKDHKHYCPLCGAFIALAPNAKSGLGCLSAMKLSKY